MDEDFKELHNKSKENVRSCFNAMLNFLVDEKVFSRTERPFIKRFKFSTPPKKRTLSREHRQAILDELGNLVLDIDCKVYWAIFWLLTYPVFRKCEIIRLNENQIILDDLGYEYLQVWDDKIKNYKQIDLDPSDVQVFQSLKLKYPPGSKDAPFFRYPGREDRYKKDHLPRWWEKTYLSLKSKYEELNPNIPFKIPWIPLNAAGRNSGITNAKKEFGKDLAKIASQHITDSSFDRYVEEDNDEGKRVYAFLRPRCHPKLLQVNYKFFDPLTAASKAEKSVLDQGVDRVIDGGSVWESNPPKKR